VEKLNVVCILADTAEAAEIATKFLKGIKTILLNEQIRKDLVVDVIPDCILIDKQLKIISFYTKPEELKNYLSTHF
jgi:hypothetical protein